MDRLGKLYIDGSWVPPKGTGTTPLVNPATEETCGEVCCASSADVADAVAAAGNAFSSYSQTARADRIELLQSIMRAFAGRKEELTRAVTNEMGCPISLSQSGQFRLGLAHLGQMLETLQGFTTDRPIGSTLIRREPIGVCGLITPWNWPINQVMVKVIPALAAGCTIVLKPSEVSPLSATILTEVLHDAGVPKGVFNLVHGTGIEAGRALCSHEAVDMVSFTGSTRAGISIAKDAADTVKRVHQELGGKSANIILDDADLDSAVAAGVRTCFMNSGQNCNAPSRMLVHIDQLEQAAEIAVAVAGTIKVGDPFDEATNLGPVATAGQFRRVQDLISSGISDGAAVLVGGIGRPNDTQRGYFVKPTIFADVDNNMRIAREEIFGPVLSILTYRDEDEAVRIANDSRYGLYAFVSSSNIDRARAIAKRLRVGQVNINSSSADFAAPFGGYKQSGNGREWGAFGLEEFLETKAILGFGAATAT